MKNNDINLDVDELEEFISKRMNAPLLRLRKQPKIQRIEENKQKLFKMLKKEPLIQLDNLLADIDIEQTSSNHICYLAGLTDGVKLNSILKI